MIYVWLMHLHMAIQLHPHIPIQPIKVSSWALAASRPQRRIWAPHTPGSGVLGKQGATKRTWPYLFQYQHHGYNCQPDPHKNAALAFGTNLKQTIHSWEINIHQHDSKSTLCMHMFEKWYGTLVLLLSFANKCSSVAENLKLIPKQTTDGFWCFWVHDVTQKRTDLRISTPVDPRGLSAVSFRRLDIAGLCCRRHGILGISPTRWPASAWLNWWSRCRMFFAYPLHQIGQMFAESFPDGLFQHRTVRC